jgi:hypothetical protein
MLKLTILAKTHFNTLKLTIWTMIHSGHAKEDDFDHDTLQIC